MSAKVLIADDLPLVRKGVLALLAGQGSYEIVGETANGREAVEMARRHMPDIVLMAPGLAGLNGAEATCRILRECPGVAVLAFSMHSDARHVSMMLAAGASGYLLKTCDTEDLLDAIEVALKGGKYLAVEVVSTVVDGYVNGLDASKVETSGMSIREQEVLQLLSEGKTAKDIGRILHVSSRTIDSHRQRIMTKLDIHSVAELTKCAIRMGLTTVEV
jgi:DNA-binding NarL/FixJ family response regulator